MWVPDFKALPKDSSGNFIEDEGTATAILPCAVEVANADREPLSRIKLLPYGTYRGSDGSGPWSLQGQAEARDVLERSLKFQRGDNFPIYYDHQAVLSTRPGTSVAGWVELQTLAAEDDGIYGDVTWTPPGYDAVANREHRYLELVVRAIRATGQVTRLIGAGLTNSPKGDVAQLASQSYNLNSAELEACEMLGIDPADFPSETQQLASAQRASEAASSKLTAAERDACEMVNMDPADFLRARQVQRTG